MPKILLAAFLCQQGNVSATSWLDRFVRVGKVLRSVPNQEQTDNLYDALEILSKTETGRKVMTEAGLSLAVDDREKLMKKNIHFRVAPMDTYATTESPARGENKGRLFVLTVNMKYAGIHPAALAPIIGHELAHMKDQKAGVNTPAGGGARERRGYLLQTHIAMELFEQGLLPQADQEERPHEAYVILDQRIMINVWEGDPLPSDRYGKSKAHQVVNLNNKNKKAPGLAALIAFADFRNNVAPILGWDAARMKRSPYIQRFDKDLVKEDQIFRKKLALAKKEKAKSMAKEAASLARAARMPSDAAETLAAIAKKACVAPARIGPSDLESLHSWFPNPGYDIPSSDRVAASLADCDKEVFEFLIAYNAAWRDQQIIPREISSYARRFVPEPPVPVAAAAPPLSIDWSAAKLATLAKKACASPGSIGGRDMDDINDWFPNPGIPDTGSVGDSLSGCAKELYIELLEKNRTHTRGNGLNYEWVIYKAGRIAEERARKKPSPPRYTPPPPTPPPREKEEPRGESGPECMKTRCVPL